MATAHKIERPLLGHAQPRIAPPTPARSNVAEFQEEAEGIGLTLIPAQCTIGRYLYALAPDDRWLYPEVAAIVARQNGKTKVLLPHILRRLRMGRRILHAAQTRELPRRLFNQLAPLVLRQHPDATIRRGAGQETIELPNGGLYIIAAATGGGARGIDAIDDLLVDEVREIDEDFIGAALPTTTVSANPQVFYLSNAGHEGSLVLNAIRDRAGDDPALAYLEWSADPGRDPGDRDGWAEANPALGHFPTLLDTLARLYASSRLSRSMARFETEHLCRWVKSVREPLAALTYWAQCELPLLEGSSHPVMGISMDPAATRASASIAWRRNDGTIGLRLLFDVTGNPIKPERLGKDLQAKARELGVSITGFDPLTDAQLARYFRRKEPIVGAKFANASAGFVTHLEANTLKWADSPQVGTDLSWTTRKTNDERGSFEAVRADDDRPITAALSAIRAVWLASEPRPEPSKSVPSAVGF